MGSQDAKGYAWLDMRQAWDIWLIIKVNEVGIRLNKERKTHDNAITTRHIQGSPREKANIKVKRNMKLLLKVMEVLDSHTLKEKCSHGHQMQNMI